MKKEHPPQNGSSSPDEALDLLLDQVPLQTPSDWFVTQTIARIRRESVVVEKRSLRWIWAGAASLCLLLFWTGFEIYQQSQNEVLSITSLDVNNWSEGIEDSWPGQ
ncbi:MAG: hypothetical protein V4507_02715 [Verrucomicrobiota bacterium]